MVIDAGNGGTPLVGNPIKMSLTPWRLRKRAPGLGQDTDAVLERLGFAPAEIADLKRLGVLDRKEKPNADRQDR